jgi:hypothetical protein
MQMPNVTLAKDADLLPLLDLYRVAEVSLSAEPVDRVQQIWSEMLSNESISVFVSNVDAGSPRLVAGKAMGGPSFTLPLQRLGSGTATMCCFRVVAKTRERITSTSTVVSSQGFEPVMLRIAP